MTLHDSSHEVMFLSTALTISNQSNVNDSLEFAERILNGSILTSSQELYLKQFFSGFKT